MVNHGLPKDLSLVIPWESSSHDSLSWSMLAISAWHLLSSLPERCPFLFLLCTCHLARWYCSLSFQMLLGKFSVSLGRRQVTDPALTERQIINHLLGYNQESSRPKPMKVCGDGDWWCLATIYKFPKFTLHYKNSSFNSFVSLKWPF